MTFSANLLSICSCAWVHCSDAWTNLGQASAITDYLTSDSRILDIERSSSLTQWMQRSQICKTRPLHHRARHLIWCVVFGFLQIWCCPLWPDISTLVSSFQWRLIQKSCGLFRCNCGHVVFREKRLSPGKCSKYAVFVFLFF